MMRRCVRIALLFVFGYASASAAEAGPATKSSVRLESVPEIARLVVESRFHGYESAVDRDHTGGKPAYDYGVHLLWDTDWKMYRMYTGGRWRRPGILHADGDHVLQHVSRTGRGGTWFSRGRPEFWIGLEAGRQKGWWVGNCLEPEVIKVQNVYYMFWQVMITQGEKVDTGETATSLADRIGLSTSTDGLHWDRKTDRGVVLNIDNPAGTKLTHQEAVYVADDPNGRPWWLYVFYIVDGKPRGHVRLRSNVPDTFDWREREACSGMAQIGNQIAYTNRTRAGRMFLRITFVTDPKTKRKVPCLQFSRDGLNWTFGADGLALLEGSRNDDRNTNCYFLGLSTIDGTGQLQSAGTNRYQAIYGATTCRMPVAPEIFHSEIGVGEAIIGFVGRRTNEVSEQAPAGDALKAAPEE
jgi:hypothetical protein